MKNIFKLFNHLQEGIQNRRSGYLQLNQKQILLRAISVFLALSLCLTESLYASNYLPAKSQLASHPVSISVSDVAAVAASQPARVARASGVVSALIFLLLGVIAMASPAASLPAKDFYSYQQQKEPIKKGKKGKLDPEVEQVSSPIPTPTPMPTPKTIEKRGKKGFSAADLEKKNSADQKAAANKRNGNKANASISVLDKVENKAGKKTGSKTNSKTENKAKKALQPEAKALTKGFWSSIPPWRIGLLGVALFLLFVFFSQSNGASASNKPANDKAPAKKEVKPEGADEGDKAKKKDAVHKAHALLPLIGTALLYALLAGHGTAVFASGNKRMKHEQATQNKRRASRNEVSFEKVVTNPGFLLVLAALLFVFYRFGSSNNSIHINKNKKLVVFLSLMLGWGAPVRADKTQSSAGITNEGAGVSSRIIHVQSPELPQEAAFQPEQNLVYFRAA